MSVKAVCVFDSNNTCICLYWKNIKLTRTPGKLYYFLFLILQLPRANKLSTAGETHFGFRFK